MEYTLADLKSGRIINGFQTEAEALQSVLDTMELSGSDAVQTFALANDHGLLLEGNDLIALARRHQQQLVRKTA